jgi:hypothetical protein
VNCLNRNAKCFTLGIDEALKELDAHEKSVKEKPSQTILKDK